MDFLKIMIGLLLLWTTNAGWAESPQSCQENIELSNIESSSGLKSISGEIISITSSQVVIDHNGICFTFCFGPEICFLCNGRVAGWQSLRPVTNQSFFEAQVFLDRQNQVTYLQGNYRGEECIIDNWETESKNLTLALIAVNNGACKKVVVNPKARLPKEKWLATGQLVFVLYNSDGQIRAIYLPD